MQRKSFWISCIFWLVMLFGMTVYAEDVVKVYYNGVVDYDYSNEVFKMVNEERAAAGLKALVSNEQLQKEATIRAAECALYYNHTRPDGTKGSLIISNRKGWYGENIAYGYTSSWAVMNGWMNSEGHKANILNSKYTQIGVGCFYHEGIWYWAQLFNGNSTSGALKTGRYNTLVEIETLPSMLSLTIGKNYNGYSFSIAEQGTEEIGIFSKNASGKGGYLHLWSNSPGLTWNLSGGIKVAADEQGKNLIVTGNTAGSGSVSVSVGSANASVAITVEHVPGEVSCTEGQFCTVCNTLLKEATGHSRYEYNRCEYGVRCGNGCGYIFEPAGHTPGDAATCTTDQRCTVCYERIVGKLGHDYAPATCKSLSTCTRCGITTGWRYGDHSWGEWQTLSKATYVSRERQQRTCSICGRTETQWYGNVLQRVTGIDIEGKKATLLAGKKMTLTASIMPYNAANKEVTWISSNKKYATVTSKGVVKAKKAGAGKTVTIRAVAKDGSNVQAVYTLYIKGAVKKIELKAAKTLRVNRSLKITANVIVGKGGSAALKWISSNKKYAAVSANGVVKAKKAGKGKRVTITAIAKDGSGKKASVTIRIKK